MNFAQERDSLLQQQAQIDARIGQLSTQLDDAKATKHRIEGALAVVLAVLGEPAPEAPKPDEKPAEVPAVEAKPEPGTPTE